MQGVVFEIERWSLSDGPGTRTVVFLKGCPLRCQWCANPESQKSRPQIGIFTAKCIGCEKCTACCTKGVARPAKEGGFAPEGVCAGCGECIEACPPRSRRWMGQWMDSETVLDEIRKDRIFYRKSGGGVTFSGGEPFVQAAFLRELIEGCQRIGIHTAVETCGAFGWEAASEVVGLLDFIMFDLKHMHAGRHAELTGASNRVVLENARRIAALDIPMLVRIPVIPTINDTPENIRATAAFVRDELPSAIGIEVLPYHQLGLTKYAALGMEYGLGHITPPEEARMKAVKEMITAAGVACITPDTCYGEEERPTRLRVVGSSG